MLDYKDQIKSIYEYIKRSESEQKHPYAYEICLLVGVEETALTSRTSGTKSFNHDIEKAVEKAKLSHGVLRVNVFGGKSYNAKKLNTYTVNVSGILNPPTPPIEEAVIMQRVDDKIKQYEQRQNTGGLGEIDSLLGLVSGENGEVKSRLEGLFGVFNALSGNNKEIDRINYQKQLDDFKYETRFNGLQEKYEILKAENAELKAYKSQFEGENKDLKAEKLDLEARLAGYSSTELMKRVAIGAVANLGGRILTNSPKTAELLGLTPQELKGALGFVEDETEHPQANQQHPHVEVEEVGNPQTPEERQKAEIIKNLSEALTTWELEEVAKIANIVGLCLDKAERINQTLAYLNKSMQGVEPHKANEDEEV